MQRGEAKMSARIAALRDSGVKAARTTVLEMEVLNYLKCQYHELRERIASRRAEMVGELHEMGYGPDDTPLDDWRIPKHVRRWLVDNQRHVNLRGQIQQLQAELTDLPPAKLPLEEGQPDARDHQMTTQSCRVATITIASRLSARVAQLADAGVKAARTVMLEMMALEALEGKCATLSERIFSKRTEMVGKLHKMGLGPDDTPPDDQSMPKEVHMWLVDYREHMHLQKRLERLRADFIDQPHPDLPHWRVEHKQHLDLKEQVKRLAAEVTNQLQVDAPLPERLQGLPHAADRKMTVRNRRGAISGRNNDSCI